MKVYTMSFDQFTAVYEYIPCIIKQVSNIKQITIKWEEVDKWIEDEYGLLVDKVEAGYIVYHVINEEKFANFVLRFG